MIIGEYASEKVGKFSVISFGYMLVMEDIIGFRNGGQMVYLPCPNDWVCIFVNKDPRTALCKLLTPLWILRLNSVGSSLKTNEDV
jgi:hypothetical protein